MSILIRNIPVGGRVCISKKDDLKEIIFNDIVNKQVLEFETEREDNGQDIIIRLIALGYLPYTQEVKIRPKLNVILTPKEDLLYRRDGV